MAEPEEFSVEGVTGTPVTLPIATGPATGYDWEFEFPSGVERLEDGPGRDVPEANRLGGAAGGNIRVAAPPGDHVMIARLVRPWDRANAIRTVRIHLHVA